MQGEEAAERIAADHGAAQELADDPRPEDRHLPGHRPADRQAPVGVRVPAEDLAGEEHAQGAEEQEDAQDPGQLARVLVGPVQEDLGHVHQHQHDHARPGVVVQRPQEPAQRHVIVESEQAVVRLVGGRHVEQGQADPGEDLDEEQGHATRCRRRTTSPSARPPPGGWGARSIGSRVSRSLQPGVEPVARGKQPALHGGFPLIPVPGCPAGSESAAPGPPAGEHRRLASPGRRSGRGRAAAGRRRVRRWRSRRRRGRGT